jgi:hypothetical protein
MAKKTTTKIARSAEDGRFVTKKYANSHKKTTVIETVKKKK